MDVVRVSKAMSFLLRHRPGTLVLDSAGWCDLDALVSAVQISLPQVTLTDVLAAVRDNDKQRFVVDGTRIRATQGHSIPVTLGYSTATPPAVLWHGTTDLAWESIRTQGLRAGRRHDVHLSVSVDTATAVGARRAGTVLIRVDTASALAQGITFRVTPNGVWLTAALPASCLSRQV